MKKKFLALALATTMAAGILSGCGNKEVASDSKEAKEVAEESSDVAVSEDAVQTLIDILRIQ